MKNTIIINIDTEADQTVTISKPDEINPPETKEQTKEMLDNDIKCVFEALRSLIEVSDQSGYTSKESLVNASITHLNNMLKKN